MLAQLPKNHAAHLEFIRLELVEVLHDIAANRAGDFFERQCRLDPFLYLPLKNFGVDALTQGFFQWILGIETVRMCFFIGNDAGQVRQLEQVSLGRPETDIQLSGDNPGIKTPPLVEEPQEFQGNIEFIHLTPPQIVLVSSNIILTQ